MIDSIIELMNVSMNTPNITDYINAAHLSKTYKVHNFNAFNNSYYESQCKTVYQNMWKSFK